jgi:hypothetical protein
MCARDSCRLRHLPLDESGLGPWHSKICRKPCRPLLLFLSTPLCFLHCPLNCTPPLSRCCSQYALASRSARHALFVSPCSLFERSYRSIIAMSYGGGGYGGGGRSGGSNGYGTASGGQGTYNYDYDYNQYAAYGYEAILTEQTFVAWFWAAPSSLQSLSHPLLRAERLQRLC